jgi:hypothetical protein
MALVTTGISPSDVWQECRPYASAAKASAQNWLSLFQNTSVSATLVNQFLDQVRGLIGKINDWLAVAGIDAYATGQNYGGTLTADMTMVKTSAQACIDWVYNNYPKDAQGYMQAQKLQADGTRIDQLFAPGATSGLQTALTNLIATITT